MKKKFLSQNRFWGNTEKWTKVHKIVHEKVAAEDEGTLLCHFFKIWINFNLMSNPCNIWSKYSLFSYKHYSKRYMWRKNFFEYFIWENIFYFIASEFLFMWRHPSGCVLDICLLLIGQCWHVTREVSHQSAVSKYIRGTYQL